MTLIFNGVGVVTSHRTCGTCKIYSNVELIFNIYIYIIQHIIKLIYMSSVSSLPLSPYSIVLLPLSLPPPSSYLYLSNFSTAFIVDEK